MDFYVDQGWAHFGAHGPLKLNVTPAGQDITQTMQSVCVN